MALLRVHTAPHLTGAAASGRTQPGSRSRPSARARRPAARCRPSCCRAAASTAARRRGRTCVGRWRHRSWAWAGGRARGEKAGGGALLLRTRGHPKVLEDGRAYPRLHEHLEALEPENASRGSGTGSDGVERLVDDLRTYIGRSHPALSKLYATFERMAMAHARSFVAES